MAEKILLTILIILFANIEFSVGVATNCTDGCLSGDQRVSLILQLFQTFQEALRNLASCFTDANQGSTTAAAATTTTTTTTTIITLPTVTPIPSTRPSTLLTMISTPTTMKLSSTMQIPLTTRPNSSTLILRNDVNGTNYFFNRSFAQFKQSFGNPSVQYWVGLDYLASKRNCGARFDLRLRDSTTLYAQYSTFSVGNSSTNYRLTISGYSGNAGDAMAVPSGDNGFPFTTYDSDNDAWVLNCAAVQGGGFWYNACGYAYITAYTSPPDNFFWMDPGSSVFHYLNSVEAHLLC